MPKRVTMLHVSVAGTLEHTSGGQCLHSGAVQLHLVTDGIATGVRSVPADVWSTFVRNVVILLLSPPTERRITPSDVLGEAYEGVWGCGGRS